MHQIPHLGGELLPHIPGGHPAQAWEEVGPVQHRSPLSQVDQGTLSCGKEKERILQVDQRPLSCSNNIFNIINFLNITSVRSIRDPFPALIFTVIM